MSTAAKAARNLLGALEIPVEAAREVLWDLPAEVIVNTPVSGAGILGFSPVVDGEAVLSHPADALAAGVAQDVPWIIGWNKDEFFGADIRDDEEDLRKALVRFGEANVDEIVRLYRKQSPGLSNAGILRQAVTDGTMGRASIALAGQKLAGTTTPLWMYLFTFELGGRAGHGYEIPFVFDNIAAIFPTSASRQKLADEMSDAWIAFARNGDPNHSDLPAWPSYTRSERTTMTFNRGDCTRADDPSPETRQLWIRIDAPLGAP
jgi:para-nitrobenzyl esterase